MDNTGTLGVLGCADGADQCGGDTGTQVDAHDDGIDQFKGHHTGGGKGLQDTHHRRRGLDDDGEDQAGKDTQNRHIAEVAQHIHKGLRLRQRLHSVRHGNQAHKEDTKAHSDHTHVLGAVLFDEHQQQDTQDQGQRGQGVRLKETQEGWPGGLDIHQADDLGGDGGADVGTQDDAHRLLEVQDACTDQTHRENDGGGGALDDGCHQCAGEKAQERVVSQLSQHIFQCRAGALLETVTHHLHAVEEHGQAAKKFNQSQDRRHTVLSISF